MVRDVRMHMVKHIVSAEKIIVVDDVNFDIAVRIMFIYIIILAEDGKRKKKHPLILFSSINK
jgi:hypothetical protein